MYVDVISETFTVPRLSCFGSRGWVVHLKMLSIKDNDTLLLPKHP